MGLRDAGPVAPRTPVHAGRAHLERRGGDACLAGSHQLHPSSQAHGTGAGSGSAAGAGSGTGA